MITGEKISILFIDEIYNSIRRPNASKIHQICNMNSFKLNFGYLHHAILITDKVYYAIR